MQVEKCWETLDNESVSFGAGAVEEDALILKKRARPGPIPVLARSV